MPFSLLQVVKARSKLELAGRIRKEWAKLAPTDKIPAVVAISNRLGDLEKDRDAWWLSAERPAVRQAFERVTGVAFRDLPLARSFVVAPDFAKLRPLRPGQDQPLALYTPDWFEPPGRRAARHWIIAPPGSGRSLAVQWHRVSGTARAMEVQALSEASDLVAVDVPILVSVDGPPSDSDDAILRRLDGRDSVVVIATYAPPQAERRPDDARVQDEGRAEPEGRDQWFVERWQLKEGWRADLVKSIAARIEEPDTLLDTDETIGWLDEVDPRCETFATPGDVIAICAIVHEAGVRSFRRDAIGPFLRARFKEEAARDREGSVWLRSWGLELVRALAVARMRDVSLPLWGPLTREGWRALAPGDLAPAALTERDIDVLLDRKRTPPREARRRLLQRSGPEAIELLADARLLRPHGDGLSLHPRWLGLAIAREYARREILEGAPRTWGRWAVDRDRRVLVDGELDHLTLDELDRVANRVCDTFDRTSLGSVGAIEAAFAAIGRRLSRDIGVSEKLVALWDLQRGLLAPRYADNDTLEPVTRPGFEHGSDWIACCWRWSLYGPRATVDNKFAWLFPGWSSPSLTAMAPLARMSLDEPGWGTRAERDGCFQYLLALSDEVVGRMTDASVPNEVPIVLLPAILLAAHRRSPRWRLGRAHIAHLAGRIWSGPYVAKRVAALAPADQAAVARTLWAAAGAPGDGLRSALDAFRDAAELLGVVTHHLPTEDFEATLVPTDVEALDRLHAIPPRLRLPLVRHVVTSSPSTAPDLDDVLGTMAWNDVLKKVHYDQRDVPWIELLVDADRFRSRSRATFWSIAPDRALVRALATPLDTTDAADWYGSAPGHAYRALLQHLATHDQLPPWVTRWLRRRLLDAGVDADLAFDLLHRAPAG